MASLELVRSHVWDRSSTTDPSNHSAHRKWRQHMLRHDRREGMRCNNVPCRLRRDIMESVGYVHRKVRRGQLSALALY